MYCYKEDTAKRFENYLKKRKEDDRNEQEGQERVC